MPAIGTTGAVVPTATVPSDGVHGGPSSSMPDRPPPAGAAGSYRLAGDSTIVDHETFAPWRRLHASARARDATVLSPCARKTMVSGEFASRRPDPHHARRRLWLPVTNLVGDQERRDHVRQGSSCIAELGALSRRC